MNFIKGLFKFLIFIAIIVGLGFLGAKKIKEARAKDASIEKAKIYPIVVSTIIPKISEVQLTLPFLAEVANDKDVKLASKIPARILYIKASGSKVKKGDVIIRLDTTDLKSSMNSIKDQMKATKIALRNLIATHKRTKELLKVQGASIEQSQKELTQIANMRAKLNSLKEKEIEINNNLSYATITSPVDGIISKTFASVGAISAPAKPLVAISSKNGFYLMVRVPTNLSINGVKFNNKFYNATPLNTTFHGLAEYKVYTGNENLISGDRVEVNVIIFKQKATLLPFDAILNRDGKSFVLEINGDRATPKEIKIIQSGEEGVAILDNLENKKIVVAKPDILLKLVSGYKLKVKE